MNHEYLRFRDSLSVTVKYMSLVIIYAACAHIAAYSSLKGATHGCITDPNFIQTSASDSVIVFNINFSNESVS